MANRFVSNAISYHGKGAIQEIPGLVAAKGFKKAFIATDPDLVKFGVTKKVTDILDANGMAYEVYSDIKPNPTIENVQSGVAAYKASGADYMITVGGGSSMDTGKAIGIIINNPEFADVRSLEGVAPTKNRTVYTIAVPTTAGTGSEVTEYAVVTDLAKGVKYPLADYELLPDMAIVDADMMMNAPKGLTASSGIDAVTHALEAYASMLATGYTDGLALRSLKLVFENLPRAYDNGPTDPRARENMANAATMAGMAFANAFLGVCHSMAHKLGAFHHLPHGVANALMIEEVIRFNSSEAPVKMGTFSQYDHPHTMARYAEVADYLGLSGKTDEKKVEKYILSIR